MWDPPLRSSNLPETIPFKGRLTPCVRRERLTSRLHAVVSPRSVGDPLSDRQCLLLLRTRSKPWPSGVRSALTTRRTRIATGSVAPQEAVLTGAVGLRLQRRCRVRRRSTTSFPVGGARSRKPCPTIGHSSRDRARWLVGFGRALRR